MTTVPPSRFLDGVPTVICDGGVSLALQVMPGRRGWVFRGVAYIGAGVVVDKFAARARAALVAQLHAAVVDLHVGDDVFAVAPRLWRDPGHTCGAVGPVEVLLSRLPVGERVSGTVSEGSERGARGAAQFERVQRHSNAERGRSPLSRAPSRAAL